MSNERRQGAKAQRRSDALRAATFEVGEFAIGQGNVSHAFIEFIAERFGPAPTPSQVVEAGRLLDSKGLSPNLAASARTAALTRAARYFRKFARPGWELFGIEVRVGDIRFDLVWVKNGRVEVDEIKTGRIGAWTDPEGVRLQLAEQFLAGRHRWGDDFNGVRLVPLLQPEKSYLYKGEDLP